ncbi:MAG: hypothetical protein OJF62_000727 [Pseudolabrys sp.]|jgi:hypothetical protein|nr:hypothetical protein [Pseudolabrys sp.]
MSEPQGRPNPEPDATAAALIARVKRLMIVTMATTFTVLAIVLIVIGYRVSRSGESAPAATEDALPLPAGAKVLSAAINDGRITVAIETPGGAEILNFDQKTLKPIGRIRLVPSQ